VGLSIRLTVLVSNSESVTRVSADAYASRGSAANLADAAPGRLVVVTAIDTAGRAALVPEGLDVGVEVTVERRLALGGPVIVSLGRTRLAIARSLAAGVSVRPASASGPAC
jgi:Fe2+ transport system protein FeoA